MNKTGDGESKRERENTDNLLMLPQEYDLLQCAEGSTAASLNAMANIAAFLPGE